VRHLDVGPPFAERQRLGLGDHHRQGDAAAAGRG
jgi:hypothetical protein